MEIWKDIKGYEGLYQVSSKGIVKDCNGIERKQRTDTYGYKIVTLRKNGEYKSYKVHRLVGIAFISNPENLPCINHKDEVKSNNNVENLEWCTSKYNSNYGHRNEKIAKAAKERSHAYMQGERNYFYGKHFSGGEHPTSKRVAKLDGQGNVLAVFDCTKSAAESVNCSPSAISLGCRGKRKNIKGYQWKYLEKLQ